MDNQSETTAVHDGLIAYFTILDASPLPSYALEVYYYEGLSRIAQSLSKIVVALMGYSWCGS